MSDPTCRDCGALHPKPRAIGWRLPLDGTAVCEFALLCRDCATKHDVEREIGRAS